MLRSVVIAAALLCPALAVQAADHDSARRAVEAGKFKPLAEILAAVQATHAGRVLDVELENGPGGRPYYEIKLLNKDGQRVELHVDAVTGLEVSAQNRPPGGLMPMGTVLRQLLAAQPGLVKHAELEEQRDRRQVYEITVELADGREQRFVADAHTGRMLSTDGSRIKPPGTLQPLPDLIESIEKRYRARAVEVEVKMNSRGAPYYEIELQLPNGRGLEVNVDAVTGKVLREEPND
ncbi:PepSY domain-containing protein [Aquincola sp. MAHUQ-54]|uniref:PepSY domain-containing protein n=1 Tax=Aquincola agrisoli TaxID=3119538 RepID=A0AAW9QEB6_9BURK